MKNDSTLPIFPILFGVFTSLCIGIAFGMTIWVIVFQKKCNCKEIRENQIIQHKIDSLQKLLK